ncbi:neutral zinc metallopeptidase [Microbacterium sp. M3]|uniref:Neutral zinc metallopeptidase n=1 Tax=Microbacterium arthrosphaerae TaxID=792652 RepID=A0ABU4H4I7_9MICO|nr:MULTISPECIES: neutral zinc metallopeptidase [Microbacterium]MDW4573590.1 neutral zinc metallopeptidase [Microbacterium arthrosphaerae]MDW7607445.1 neutral zinc metallopeptidase [Microbacterium sp. M3]
MTFNENANVGGNTARRRGGGVAIAGGGLAGLGAIAFLLFQLFTGQDLSSIAPALPQTGSGGETEIEQCETGADANRNDACRLAAGSLVLDQYWETQVQGYRAPTLVIVDQQTSSACGTASNQTGPFYCPPEETVYIDPTFFGLLRERFDASAGDLAQLYVLAHEYGHHVQHIAGIMDQHPSNGTGPESNGVRMELQADCFAGAWVGDMTEQRDENGVPYLRAPTQQQIADAIDAAGAVGDDHIQQESGGFVNPESWTHGSSEQRQGWFQTGYQSGVSACDTFAVPGGSL